MLSVVTKQECTFAEIRTRPWIEGATGHRSERIELSLQTCLHPALTSPVLMAIVTYFGGSQGTSFAERLIWRN